MVRFVGKPYLMTLPLAAVMGLLTVGTPCALAATPALTSSSSSADLLASLGARKVVPYLSCCQLGDYRVYLLAAVASSRPAAVLLEHMQPEGHPAAEAARVAERFQRVYKLHGYRLQPARKGCAAFLFREEASQAGKRYYEKDIFWLLKAEEGLSGAVNWLNDRCGGGPHCLENGQLIWSGELAVRHTTRPYEVFLPLLGGAPRRVDVRLRHVPTAAVRELLAKQLSLPLRQMRGVTGSALRRKAGTKVLGYMGGTDLDTGAVLVRQSAEGALYRLALLSSLAKEGKEPESNLPELPLARWADELMAETPPPGEPAPLAPPSDDAGQKPAPSATPSAADAQPPANLTPAEARKAYAERLRAL